MGYFSNMAYLCLTMQPDGSSLAPELENPLLGNMMIEPNMPPSPSMMRVAQVGAT